MAPSVLKPARRAGRVEGAPSVAASWALAELVSRLRRALRFSVRSEFAWERLPMAQVELLHRLTEEPGLRVSDLAERHRLATNTVSNLIQQMVTTGLVQRQPDPKDRRAVVLIATALGRDSLHGWMAANTRRLGAALAAVSAEDRAAILATMPALTRLVEALEQADGRSVSSGDER